MRPTSALPPVPEPVGRRESASPSSPLGRPGEHTRQRASTLGVLPGTTAHAAVQVSVCARQHQSHTLWKRPH